MLLVETQGMIKGSLSGWRDTKWGEDYTHVRLTAEDYQLLEGEISRLESKVNEEHRKAQEAVAKAVQVQAEQNKLSQKIKDMDEAIKVAEKEAADWECRAIELENMNMDLLRVARERANSDRGLQPKSERSGYLVLSMEQVNVTFFEKNGNRYKKFERPCWKTRFQTPYNFKYDFSTVESMVREDIQRLNSENFNVKGVFSPENYSPLTEEQLDELWSEKYENFMIANEFRYKLNGAKGYWEFEMKTKYSLNLNDDFFEKIVK